MLRFKARGLRLNSALPSRLLLLSFLLPFTWGRHRPACATTALPGASSLYTCSSMVLVSTVTPLWGLFQKWFSSVHFFFVVVIAFCCMPPLCPCLLLHGLFFFDLTLTISRESRNGKIAWIPGNREREIPGMKHYAQLASCCLFPCYLISTLGGYRKNPIVLHSVSCSSHIHYYAQTSGSRKSSFSKQQTWRIRSTSRCPYCAFGFHCKFRGMRSLKLCHSC
jgi:hypothetical protein